MRLKHGLELTIALIFCGLPVGIGFACLYLKTVTDEILFAWCFFGLISTSAATTMKFFYELYGGHQEFDNRWKLYFNRFLVGVKTIGITVLLELGVYAAVTTGQTAIPQIKIICWSIAGAALFILVTLNTLACASFLMASQKNTNDFRIRERH